MNRLARYLTFDDVGLIPKFNRITSRLDVCLDTKITNKIKSSIPLIPSNMDTVIGTELAKVIQQNNGIAIFHRFAPIDTRIEWFKSFPNFFQSCGVTDWNDTEKLLKMGCHNFCIDIAHGHSDIVGNIIKKLKIYDTQVIAGNICSIEGYNYLYNQGADAIKVGVGGGAACSTRMVTGVGVPQFSAIYEIAKHRELMVKKGFNYIPIIADGGIRDTRDVCLALASGADTVMMGSLFCRTYESACPKIETTDGKIYGKYRGQASMNFQNDYYGKIKKGTVPEGIDFKVEINKSAQYLIDEYLGSLRSSMTYLGASNIYEYHKNATFFETTGNYIAESKPRPHIK